jgi:hypothetical protein
MSQLDFDGEEPRRERILALVFKMHKEGLVNDLAVGREARRLGFFPDEWADSLADKAAALEVSRILKDVGKEGVPTAISLGKPHQFRLIDWVQEAELDENILMRVGGIDADIRVTRNLCNLRRRKFPATRDQFLAKLPDYLKPDA